MGSKQDALDEVIQIARSNQLSLDDIIAAFNPSPQLEQQKNASIAARIFGYIGGLLVLGGVCLLVNMQWSKLGPAGHVAITLVPGFLALIAGLFCMRDERLERATTPLLLLAALIQPTGIMIALKEYAHGDNPAMGALFTAGVMLLQQGLIFVATQRTALAFTSIFFLMSFVATGLDLEHINGKYILLIIGAMGLAIAHALNKGAHRSIAPVHFFLGSSATLTAYASLVADTGWEITFLGLSVMFIYGAVLERSRIMLGIGAMALLSYLSYYTHKYFSGVLGWPIMLILMGAMMLSIGMGVVKINRRYISGSR